MEILNVDFNTIRKYVDTCLHNDKKSGIKKAWYFTHIQNNEMQAMDTKEQFQRQVNMFLDQNILFYKTVDIKPSTLKRAGVQSGKLLVFRKEGFRLSYANNLNGDFVVDLVSIAFDYLPAYCEIVIAEIVIDNPHTKVKPKKSR